MQPAKLTIWNALRAATLAPTAKSLSPVSANRGGWWPIVRESFPGAWQRNVTVNAESALSFHAVFACITLVASDISKLRIKLMSKGGDGVWTETSNPAYSPVLRKPNHFQTRQQFLENWLSSKLFKGNAYILKRRDSRNVVKELYVLDPMLVKPLVSDTGAVYYELSTDRTAGLTQNIVVPAREIIHDRFNCLFHPLVGISPLYASGIAATGGLAIQNTSAMFFQNGAQPGGLLIAPDEITPEKALEMKTYWQENFTGVNAGKLAVLGDGLKYEALALTAEESQLIEQLQWSAKTVCSTFHVPPFMAGAGDVPPYGNVESSLLLYYAQALQPHIEAIEACLDEGLGMSDTIGVELDLEGLLRTDTATQIKSLTEAIKGSLMSPNEARARISLPAVDGGDSPMAQQQNFSLEALSERDRNQPFSKPTPAAPASEAQK